MTRFWSSSPRSWYYLMGPGAVGNVAPDGRIGNDAVFFSMTFEDWLKDGKREHVEQLLHYP